MDPSPAPASSIPHDLAPLLIATRRHLHQRPELGDHEHETAAFITETLAMHGLEAHEIAITGRYVDIEGALPGPWVGYRADIDALPIQDTKDVPYRSTREGCAHLCGHDAHTAIGIGVALRVAAQRERLRGGVRVFFQPNEEGLPSGAPNMIEGGVLDGLEAVYAIHVDPTIATGQYGLRKGPVTASSDVFDVTVRAQTTGHSARPHETVDTVWLAVQVASALYQLAGRITDAREPQVLTICRLKGSEAYNVIPSVTTFGGTLRSTSEASRAFMHERIRSLCQHLGEAHGARITTELLKGAPAVVNDAALVDHIAATIEAERGAEAIYAIPKPSMGAEDFAHYLMHVPGVLIRVGTQNGPATSYPLHDSNFDLDESAMEPTATLMAEVLLSHAGRARG